MKLLEPASVELFSGLEENDVQTIKKAAVRQLFESQTLITRWPDVKNLFLIESGYVDYNVGNEAGREILLRRLTAGDVFGVASFLSKPSGYLGTAKAVQKVQVLVWDGQTARKLAKRYPLLMENALRTALGYLALYAKRHIGLVSNSAQERLACALSSLGSRAGHPVPGGMEVAINNEDLASLADVSFFTASRVLKDWDHHGVVEKTRGKVVIKSPERLLAA